MSLFARCVRASSVSQIERQTTLNNFRQSKSSSSARERQATGDESGQGEDRKDIQSFRMAPQFSGEKNGLDVEIQVLESPRNASSTQRSTSKRSQRFSNVDLNGTAGDSPSGPRAASSDGTPTVFSSGSGSPRPLSIRQLQEQALGGDGGASAGPLARLFRVGSSGRGLRSDSSAGTRRSSLKIRGGKAMDEGRALFSTFLNKCYSHEVLDYWDTTTQYIKMCRKRLVGDQAQELARRMVEEFVLPNAPQKLDLGEAIERPLISCYESNEWSIGSFDPTRTFLLKLLQGLRMDAIVSYGVRSATSQAISAFLEEEEREMNQLMFQRDVHPLLQRFRKGTTFAGSQASGVTSGSGVIKSSQVFTSVPSTTGGRAAGSGSTPPTGMHSSGRRSKSGSKTGTQLFKRTDNE